MSKKHTFIFLLICSLSFVACSNEDSFVPVSGIELDREHISLVTGQSTQLNATILPLDATERTLIWESSKEGIAEVNQEGLVTARTAGSTLITVSTPDKKHQARCSVSVTQKIIHVEDISLDKTSLRLMEGDSYKLRALISPEDATNKDVTWLSSNPKYVTVSDGLVTALSVGAATITATTVDGSKKASCSITVTSDPDRYTIAANKQSSFTIVYAGQAQDVAKELVKAIKGTTGATLSAQSDQASAADREILVGKTSREESTYILSKIGANGYAIATLNGKITIVATTDMMLSHALWDFQRTILQSDEYNKDGKCVLPSNYLKIVNDYTPLTFEFCLKNNLDFTVKSTKILTVPREDDCYVAQGAATDGKNFYFVLRNSTDDGAVIKKYDMKTLKLVLVSPKFNGGHCNDMTFDTHKNYIVLAHGSSQGKTLTLLDPETLTVIKDVSITVGSGAITYDPPRMNYAISQGGSTLYVADSSFKVLRSYTRTDKTGYTAQGMGSDTSYVYFPMSKTGVDNLLVTYDWYGNHITDIRVNETLESESMFSFDGRYYVCFYVGGTSKGAALYTVEPERQYVYIGAK